MANDSHQGARGSARRLSVLLGPRSHAGHAVHRDVGDVPGWGVIHWREADLRTEVGVSELLEELGSSSLGNARRAVYDQVLDKAHGVTRAGFEREGDAAVVADIAHLAVLGEVARDDLVPVQSLTWGLPSGFKVTRCARAGDSSTARALSGSDVMKRR